MSKRAKIATVVGAILLGAFSAFIGSITKMGLAFFVDEIFFFGIPMWFALLFPITIISGGFCGIFVGLIGISVTEKKWLILAVSSFAAFWIGFLPFAYTSM